MAALLSVVFAAWTYLFRQQWSMHAASMSAMWMPPSDDLAWLPVDFMLVFLMWSVMMVAMMLPSSVPMVLAFSRIAGQERFPFGRRVAIFVSAYLAVWFVFSVALTLLQWRFHALNWLSPMMENRNVDLAAAIFAVAGVYQFTALKNACLKQCRTPFGFLLSEWAEGNGGAFRMGLKHGAVCLGCCWAQMLIMFAVGVMNLLGMAMITLLVMLEKLSPIDRSLVSRAGGAAFLFWSVYLLAR
ncbi:MAG: DUF2182 domain-containing protein [Gammaproteobacteria bacterium]